MQEQVDDVQVQVQGSEAVVVNAELDLVAASHHELRVIHDVEREEEHAAEVVEHDHPHDVHTAHTQDGERHAEHHHRQHGAHQVRPSACEVGCRRPRIDGHSEEDTDCDARGQHNALPSVHGAGEPHNDAHATSEEPQEHVVLRELLQDLATTHHRAHRPDEHDGGHDQDPRIRLQRGLRHELEGQCDEDGEQELCREDAIDLPDEALAHLPVGVLDQLTRSRGRLARQQVCPLGRSCHR
mmetsp:Transcript_111486/g.300751  ORF Transcript_111486/g.300751 Transcript_111486/m.300751 type:complete len:240 (+) Transcript_111486:188-907(+)